jgi:hypothetical protein
VNEGRAGAVRDAEGQAIEREKQDPEGDGQYVAKPSSADVEAVDRRRAEIRHQHEVEGHRKRRQEDRAQQKEQKVCQCSAALVGRDAERLRQCGDAEQ